MSSGTSSKAGPLSKVRTKQTNVKAPQSKHDAYAREARKGRQGQLPQQQIQETGPEISGTSSKAEPSGARGMRKLEMDQFDMGFIGHQSMHAASGRDATDVQKDEQNVKEQRKKNEQRPKRAEVTQKPSGHKPPVETTAEKSRGSATKAGPSGASSLRKLEMDQFDMGLIAHQSMHDASAGEAMKGRQGQLLQQQIQGIGPEISGTSPKAGPSGGRRMRKLEMDQFDMGFIGHQSMHPASSLRKLEMDQFDMGFIGHQAMHDASAGEAMKGRQGQKELQQQMQQMRLGQQQQADEGRAWYDLSHIDDSPATISAAPPQPQHPVPPIVYAKKDRNESQKGEELQGKGKQPSKQTTSNTSAARDNRRRQNRPSNTGAASRLK